MPYIIPRRSSVFARVNLRRRLNASGWVQKDIVLNHVRTSKFPSNSRAHPYLFHKPASDASYSNVSLTQNRQRDGLLPKDAAWNHLQPVLAL